GDGAAPGGRDGRRDPGHLPAARDLHRHRADRHRAVRQPALRPRAGRSGQRLQPQRAAGAAGQPRIDGARPDPGPRAPPRHPGQPREPPGGRSPAGAGVTPGQPRPMNGIVVAVMVRNCTLASSGSDAMNSTAPATCSASKVGSGTTEPSACSAPRLMPSVMSVAALPMSIWPQAMPNRRPSSDRDLVSPVSACLVAVYATLPGRGVCADTEPLLMIRPPPGVWA